MDEHLRALGRAARHRVEASIDVDAAWHRLTSEVAAPPRVTAEPVPRHPRHPRQLWTWRLTLAAAAVGALVAGIVVVTRGGDEQLRSSDDPAPSVPTSPTEPTPPSTVGSSVAGSTTVPAPPVVEPTVLAVSYQDTALASEIPNPFAEIETDDDQSVRTAVGERGIVVIHGERIAVVGYDGTRREVSLEPDAGPLSAPLTGPGDVVYALRSDPSSDATELVAIALVGDRAGQVVARSEPIGEAPSPDAIVHGPAGVTDVRDGRLLMAYVDASGAPSTADLSWVNVPAWDADAAVVTVGDRAWELRIATDPDRSPSGLGTPSPGPAGTIVVGAEVAAYDIDAWDHPSTVVARIDPATGTASWSMIANGYRYEASSPWGTLVSRADADEPTRVFALLSDRLPLPTPDEFPSEPTGIPSGCADEGGPCVRLAFDPSGTPVTFDARTGTLTRHADSPESATLPDSYRDGWLWLVGPHEVAYFQIQDPGSVDPVGLLRAVSVAPGDVGRELATPEVQLDGSGDTDLVATPDGIVFVGCCSHEPIRPSPDEAVQLEWLDNPASSNLTPVPDVRIDLDREQVVVDGRAWQLELVIDELSLRGMPAIVPTVDGGFVASLVRHDLATVLVRGDPDGTVQYRRIADEGFAGRVDPAGTLLVATGDEFVRIDPFA